MYPDRKVTVPEDIFLGGGEMRVLTRSQTKFALQLVFLTKGQLMTEWGEA